MANHMAVPALASGHDSRAALELDGWLKPKFVQCFGTPEDC